MSISRFFIERPVFASVIAVLIMLAGGLAYRFLPVEQFPPMAPPTISMNVEYAGSSAQTMQDSVAQIIEQNMTGLDNLLYMSTSSSSEGRAFIRVTFDTGTNPDVAMMQVQNNLDLAMPRLPEDVKNQGIRVRKVSESFLRYMSFYDETGKTPVEDIGDFISSVLLDPLNRIDGVGEATLFGSDYAMRIWLNPDQLKSFSLTPSDVVAAVRNQNNQISVGQIGGLPNLDNQELNVTLLSRTKLNDVEQFRNVIVRVNPDGSAVRVRDVARVDMGIRSYTVTSRFRGSPAVTVGIQLAEGANAVEASEKVDAFMDRMRQFFPPGITYHITQDSVPFILASINSIVHTLIEAIVLVAAIMFLFLQSWRATLIPTLAVPIVLLGTVGVIAATGGSINTLSMFGLVLAIGLLVDDAIVVVENTERIMHMEGLPPAEAIKNSMDQITWALVGVAAVLSAVFVPMSFFGGIPGAIYRQFTLTIVSAMTLSVFVAIVITPPLCKYMLKQRDMRPGKKNLFAPFNRLVDTGTRSYASAVRTLISHPVKVMLIYVLLAAGAVVAVREMPTSFLPVEDQGTVNFNIFMPPGTPRQTTLAAAQEIEDYFKTHEGDLIEGVGVMLGMGPNSSRGQNVALGYVTLKHWDERKHPDQSTSAIVRRARAHFANYTGGRIAFSEPPQIRGLGNASGLVMQLEDQGGLGHDALIEAREDLLDLMRMTPMFFNPRTTSLDDIPQVRVDIDDLKAGVFHLSPDSINDDLSTAWGGTYVNDFVDRGRVKRVYVQGDAPYRMNPDDLRYWYFRNENGDMVPLDAFATVHWTYGPAQLERFNGVPSTAIEVSAGENVSSGEAMAEIERIVQQELPHGIGMEWSGLSFEEKRSGSQTGFLYALSILVVFLCLAALYESWTIPFAVILVVPIGVLGAMGLSTLRGLHNDIYFQVGILAVIGLSAKNAILIVEFAKTLYENGRSLVDAAVEAATMRLRPIVMTSMAFLLGVLPLTVSRGAGANSQHAIGTGIVGGTFLATALGVLFIPVFFVVINRITERITGKGRENRDTTAKTDSPDQTENPDQPKQSEQPEQSGQTQTGA